MKNIITILILFSLSQANAQIPVKSQLDLDHFEYDLWSNKDCNETQFVFLDTLGRNKFNHSFNAATDFYKEYANVVIDGKYGIIDKFGKTILFDRYDKIFWHNDSLGIAQKDSLLGFINIDGDEVIPIMYEEVSFFNEGFAGISLNGKRNFVDKSNQLLFSDSITVERKKLFPNFIIDSLLIYEGKCSSLDTINKFGIINIGSHKLTQPCYELIFGNFHEGICHIKKDKKHGYIDKSGNEIIEAIYNWTGKHREGFIPVLMERKWGYINYQGEEVIDFQFDSAKEFYSGLALVNKGGKSLYINTDGETILELNNIRPSQYHWKFQEGLAVAKEGNSEIYINIKGEKQFDKIFDKARNFVDGYACVKVNSKWGVINKKGEFIIEPEYDEIWNYKDDMFRAMKKSTKANNR